MDKLDDIVQNWYDVNEGEIDFDTRVLYLVELFKQLKVAGFKKGDLKTIKGRILFLLDDDFIDESIHMVYQKTVAEEIQYAYISVMKNIDEVDDEEAEVEQLESTVGDDIYENNTSEPDIDLRGQDLGDITYDEEFMKELGIKNG